MVAHSLAASSFPFLSLTHFTLSRTLRYLRYRFDAFIVSHLRPSVYFITGDEYNSPSNKIPQGRAGQYGLTGTLEYLLAVLRYLDV